MSVSEATGSTGPKGSGPGTPGHAFRLRMVVNGKEVETVLTDPRLSLLDFLREKQGLTGTKTGCNQGGCGACTVMIDGQRVLSCLTLAVKADEREVTTIEGLGSSSDLHPLQQAFIEHDGFQCGYCTPGQICSAVAMADELSRGLPSRVTEDVSAPQAPWSREEIQERMSGNVCRCGAYNGIIDAITDTFADAPTAHEADALRRSGEQ